MQRPSDSTLHIVLVEDSLDDAELVAAALRRAGLAAFLRRVETEAELVTALDEKVPDLALCDFHLAGFGGGRALEILRARHPGLPVIFVSRHILPFEWDALARRGATALVGKERLHELAAAIRAALGGDGGHGAHGARLNPRSG